jgi:NTE family protein
VLFKGSEGANNMATKIAIGCQGGGAHGAFEVGVLTTILKAYKNGLSNQIELVGFSGTSAGALSALMVWYGLAARKGDSRSFAQKVDAAINGLNGFWDDFAAKTDADILLNKMTTSVLKLEEAEVKPLGLMAPVFGVSPYGLIYKAVAASLPQLGVRRRYFDLEYLLNQYCPDLVTNAIDWGNVKSRLLIGASEVLNGYETVFDSYIYHGLPVIPGRHLRDDRIGFWTQRLPLTLKGVEASGTLPNLREAVHIDNGIYWDGLYSQNPPLNFFAGVERVDKPDELWILRINPQQWPEEPKTNADIKDRQNELMGNLSLNKDLDMILTINDWISRYPGLNADFKSVIVRTIKMTKNVADGLRYSSKFNRSQAFINDLRNEGEQVAGEWLANWPNNGQYPEDAAYF